MFAPNKTAKINGSGSTCNCCAIPIAMGVPITAAALFETMFVMIDIINMKILNIIGIGSPSAA